MKKKVASGDDLIDRFALAERETINQRIVVYFTSTCVA